MLTSETSPVYSNLQPRHASRRARTPGARVRHSAQLERNSPESRLKTSTRPNTALPRPSFCMQTGVVQSFQAKTQNQQNVFEPEVISSKYKELSTIEDIRAEVRATKKRPKRKIPAHIPQWMMDLDINLDVSSADIIPPFEESLSGENETFHARTKVTIVYDDEDSEADDDSLPSEESYTEFEHFQRLQKLKTNELNLSAGRRKETTKRTGISSETIRLSRSMTSLSQRTDGNENSTQRTHSPGWKTSTMVIEARKQSNPCRYQGDMKVMSMQRGGIRSTPMQPKSKKFINQMLTYRQMKIHSNKMKAVKPAVDTRMPESFKLALERKKTVEQRHSENFDRSFETSSRSSPSPRTSRSNAKDR